MQQQTISLNPQATVHVENISGDLRLAGWERSELMAKTDGDRLMLTVENGQVRIACDEDLILYLPHSVNLTIAGVAGDVRAQALQGRLQIGPLAGDLTGNDLGEVILATVAGDASLRNTGPVSAQTISGDLTLRTCRGDCSIETVGGDASLRDIEGNLVIRQVGSDCYVRNVRGNLEVTAGADVVLYLEPAPGHLYQAAAGDDLLVRLPPQVHLQLHLSAPAPENIQVDIPGVELSGKANTYDLSLGPQATDRAKMYLIAGDDLLVTMRAEAWDSAADFGIGIADGGNWEIPGIPTLPPDLSERINRRVRAAMERAQERVEAASRRAQAKVEAAMRRAEARARAAEVRARRGQGGTEAGRWDWPVRRSAERDEPVSDAERLQILKMLQEKKITVEEAEKLLAALEGKL